MHYVGLSCRCLVGVVFLISFASKITPTSFGAFVASLKAMRILPERLVRASALGVVCAEFAVFALLTWTSSARAGALLAAVLVGVFSAAIAVALVGKTAAPCRCFGPVGGQLGVRHIARNALLLLAACVVARHGAIPPAEPAVAVAAAGAGVVGALLLIGFDLVVELFGPSRSAA
ncbi:MauE/DoxX family redox-associated membrane protein [Umezawaea sp. NPDC059074]|uniref:MauE/DoxX family redox-associated membrane protein n=1 Tax=Umezawaea sp. NPDC059074 TaxID=3346716 RepID=UPI003673C7F8